MIRERTVPQARGESAFGIEEILKELVRRALRDCADVLSIAVGDGSGLPIINATKGKVPVMTYTAMATMSLRAAKTAAEAVGMPTPEYIVVHTAEGLLVVSATSSDAVLIAHLREHANLGLALTVLQKLAADIGTALET